MPLELKSILRTINASKTYPIHTENTDLFTKFMNDLKGKIVGTEKTKEYKV
jgi:hypothetical protein